LEVVLIEGDQWIRKPGCRISGYLDIRIKRTQGILKSDVLILTS